MMTFVRNARWLSAVCIAAVLAGCGSSVIGTGPEDGLTALSVSRLAATTMARYVAQPVDSDTGASWLAKKKQAGNHDYFVSDWATNDVFVYRYPQGDLVAKLTGFKEPYGQCADSHGNIWITNFEGSSIVEYAHVPTKPLATLTTNGTPIGCAVSPSGSLAVANYSTTAGPGDIQVFPHEGGTAVDYSSTTCYDLWPPGYDNKGNLYVEGSSTSGNAVCELAAKGTSLVPVTFNQTIVKPGSTMWDGEYITLTDQDHGSTDATAIYRATEDTAGNLTLAGTTVLNDTCNGSEADVPQPFLAGGKNTPDLNMQAFVVLGGNLDCKRRYDYWAYPTPSGDPILSFKHRPREPYGQAYSTNNTKKGTST